MFVAFVIFLIISCIMGCPPYEFSSLACAGIWRNGDIWPAVTPLSWAKVKIFPKYCILCCHLIFLKLQLTWQHHVCCFGSLCIILIIQSHAILSSFFLHHLFLIVSPTDGPSHPPRLEPHKLADENAAEQTWFMLKLCSLEVECATLLLSQYSL